MFFTPPAAVTPARPPAAGTSPTRRSPRSLPRSTRGSPYSGKLHEPG